MMNFLKGQSGSGSANTINTKTLFAPKAGKQATKGQKQIYQDNMATIKYYQMTSLAVIGSSLLLTVLFFRESAPWANGASAFFLAFALAIYGASISAMRYMAKPAFAADSKTLVDGGIDLNMESGFAENLKDLVILTWIVQILSIYSNKFWLVWLLVPGKALYMLWSKVLAPWFFAPAPEETVSKTQEKKMRQSSRRGYR